MRAPAVVAVAMAVVASPAAAQSTLTRLAQAEVRIAGLTKRVTDLEAENARLRERAAGLEARDQAWSSYVALQACIWNGTYQGSTVLRAIPGLGPYQLPTGYTCPATAPTSYSLLPLRPR